MRTLLCGDDDDAPERARGDKSIQMNAMLSAARARGVIHRRRKERSTARLYYCLPPSTFIELRSRPFYLTAL